MKHLDSTIVDVLSLEIALIIAVIIRFGHPYLFADPHYQLLATLLPVFHITIVFFSEEYSSVLQRGYLQGFKAVLKHKCILGALIFSYFLLPSNQNNIHVLWYLPCWGWVFYLYMSRD